MVQLEADLAAAAHQAGRFACSRPFLGPLPRSLAAATARGGAAPGLAGRGRAGPGAVASGGREAVRNGFVS